MFGKLSRLQLLLAVTYVSKEETAWQFPFMPYSWQKMSSAVQNASKKILMKDLQNLHCQTIYSEKEVPDSSLSFACMEDEDLTLRCLFLLKGCLSSK